MEKSLAQQLIEENMRTRNPILDLGNCGLRGDAPELAMLEACVWLETLVFSNWWSRYDAEKDERVLTASQNTGEKNQLVRVPDGLLGLSQLTALHLSGNLISDITALAGLKNLAYVALKMNQISDLYPLENLTKLTSLGLAGNKINNISALKDLKKLTSLDLSNNKISNIAGLKGLHALTSLNLSNNEISDISDIKDLTGLASLDLSYNKISDIAALNSLKGLASLRINNNQLKQLSLSGFENLADFGLTGNPLLSLQLRNCPKLQTLKYNESKLEEIDLQDLTGLTDLEFRSNKITSIANLKRLPSLTSLVLSGNSIRDISALAGLTALSSLHLSSNHIDDLSPLKDLKGLTSLGLRSTQISDLSPLKDLKGLTSLDFNSNQISDLSPLEGLKDLTDLNLGYNKISDLSSLKDLERLASLDLRSNQISDLSPLKDLKGLTSLMLGKNKITDIAPLEGLAALTILGLNSNEIAFLPLNLLRDFPHLEGLDIRDNPIQNLPSHIPNSNLSTIRHYLQDLAQGASLDRAVNVVFIGKEGVGKTQIANRLAEGEAFQFNSQHDAAQPLVVRQKVLGDLILNLWDFSRQNLNEATKSLLMKLRVLFVLVWDIENENSSSFIGYDEKEKDEEEKEGEQNEKIPHWLDYTTPYAMKRPILVVQNKVNTEEGTQALAQAYQDELKQKYPIIDFLQVNAENGMGFSLLEHHLERAFYENKYFKSSCMHEFPTSWVNIRQEIRTSQQAGIKEITHTDFDALCEAQGVLESKLAIFAHVIDIGVLYHLQNRYEHKLFIDPASALEYMKDSRNIPRHFGPR